MSDTPTISRLQLGSLTVACLYVLTDRACLDFPGTCRAHPSLFVQVIVASGRLWYEGDRPYFPVRCPWDIWQYVVVPILKDPEFQKAAKQDDRDTLTEKLQAALHTSLVAHGYLPAGT